MDATAALAFEQTTDPHVVSEDTVQLVNEVHIPPCPAVLIDFMAEMHKDDPDFRRLGHLIHTDPGLAASVMKTVNSPVYGTVKKARSVQDGLALLGLRPASMLVAGLMLRQAFTPSTSASMHEFWDSSARIAMISGYLAPKFEAGTREEAHTFALFRDCGIPILLNRYPDYEQLLTETRYENEFRRPEIERARYGFDHAVLGATLAQTWHLSNEMCQAIRFHNCCVETEYRDGAITDSCTRLICVALLAEQLYRIYRGTYDAEAWSAEDAMIAEVLGPVQDRLEPLGDEVARILDGA